MPTFDLVFFEIAVAMLTAGLISLLVFRLRQPLIIAYILTGLIIGPSLLGAVKSSELFETMSQLGIAFLLFLTGLGLNWKHIRQIGAKILVMGFGQVAFTTIVGFGLVSALGYDSITSLVVAFAFAFSSTVIIVKLLSDKDDLERLYGRLAVGMLIVQDLIAIIALLFLSTWHAGGGLVDALTFSLLKGAIVIVALWLIAHLILPSLMRYAAQSQELLFLMSLSWCFALSSALYLLGFSIEIGALLAGVTLASSGFEREIMAKVKPLRDFFIIIFFIVLGTHLPLFAISQVIKPALILSMFVLIGNPLIVILLMRLLGYHPRTGFLVGTTVAQISEFSIIVLTAGVAYGLIDRSVMPMATLVALITLAASSYLINYNEWLYEKGWFLFEWLAPKRPEPRLKGDESVPSVIMFGYHRMGEVILPTVKAMREKYLVVDLDPAAIEELNAAKIPVVYGDAGDQEVLTSLKAEHAKLLISTIPDANVSIELLDYCQQHGSKAAVVVTVKTAEQAARMYELGATFVIVPSILGGKLFADFLKKKKTKKSMWGSLAKEQQSALGIVSTS